MELWRDIPGYEGRYQASTMGRIRSIPHKVRGKNPYSGKTFYRTIHGTILNPGKYCKTGHLSVVLGRGTAGKPVHQLIMRTFIGEPPNGMEVLHNNGNPSDNRLANLRYGSRTDNILDVYRQGGKWRKLTTDDAEGIRFGLYCGISGAELARMFRVSQTTISSIKRGRSYRWLT